MKLSATDHLATPGIDPPCGFGDFSERYWLKDSKREVSQRRITKAYMASVICKKKKKIDYHLSILER